MTQIIHATRTWVEDTLGDDTEGNAPQQYYYLLSPDNTEYRLGVDDDGNQILEVNPS